jgi:hypothetical protein
MRLALMFDSARWCGHCSSRLDEVTGAGVVLDEVVGTGDVLGDMVFYRSCLIRAREGCWRCSRARQDRGRWSSVNSQSHAQGSEQLSRA